MYHERELSGREYLDQHVTCKRPIILRRNLVRCGRNKIHVGAMSLSTIRQRIGDRPPCLVCPILVRAFQEQGLEEVAFVIPTLVRILWSAPAIPEPTRVVLNDLFVAVLRHAMGGVELGHLCGVYKPRIMELASNDPMLLELCEELFEVLDKLRTQKVGIKDSKYDDEAGCPCQNDRQPFEYN
jgi:hypothetical protein